MTPKNAKVTLSVYYTEDERWCWQLIGHNGVVLSAAGSYGKLNDAWHDARRSLVSKIGQAQEVAALGGVPK